MSRGIVIRSLARVTASPAAAQWLMILALTACSAGSMGGADSGAIGPSGTAARSRTDLETERVCRERVNEMTDKQNRPAIYAANSSLNSPFSANFLPSVPSRGLSGQFAYEQTLAECERSAGTGPDVESPVQNAIPPRAKVP